MLPAPSQPVSGFNAWGVSPTCHSGLQQAAPGPGQPGDVLGLGRVVYVMSLLAWATLKIRLESGFPETVGRQETDVPRQVRDTFTYCLLI